MRVVTLNTAGPSLLIGSCRRIFDHGQASAGDHYGLAAEFGPS